MNSIKQLFCCSNYTNRQPLQTSLDSTDSSKTQRTEASVFKSFKEFSSVAQSNINKFIKSNCQNSTLRSFRKNIDLKRGRVEVNKKESDIRNNRAQLNQVLTLFGLCLEDKGQGKFQLKETAEISKEKWKNKVLVCDKNDSSPTIVRFKLKKQPNRPNLGSAPSITNDTKLEEAFDKKVKVQKDRMKFAKDELKALLKSSAITGDSTWKDIEGKTTQENIKKIIETNLNASQSFSKNLFQTSREIVTSDVLTINPKDKAEDKLDKILEFSEIEFKNNEFKIVSEISDQNVLTANVHGELEWASKQSDQEYNDGSAERAMEIVSSLWKKVFGTELCFTGIPIITQEALFKAVQDNFKKMNKDILTQEASDLFVVEEKKISPGDSILETNPVFNEQEEIQTLQNLFNQLFSDGEEKILSGDSNLITDHQKVDNLELIKKAQEFLERDFSGEKYKIFQGPEEPFPGIKIINLEEENISKGFSGKIVNTTI